MTNMRYAYNGWNANIPDIAQESRSREAFVSWQPVQCGDTDFEFGSCLQTLSLNFNVETKRASQVIEKSFVMICRYLSEIDKKSLAETSLPTDIAKF